MCKDRVMRNVTTPSTLGKLFKYSNFPKQLPVCQSFIYFTINVTDVPIILPRQHNQFFALELPRPPSNTLICSPVPFTPKPQQGVYPSYHLHQNSFWSPGLHSAYYQPQSSGLCNCFPALFPPFHSSVLTPRFFVWVLHCSACVLTCVCPLIANLVFPRVTPIMERKTKAQSANTLSSAATRS